MFFAVCPDDPSGELRERGARYLAGRERERYRALRRRSDRSMYVFSRILLKQLLGGSLGLPAEEIEWEYDDRGHPFLSGVPAVDFSLAHSGPFFAAVIGKSLSVGIDIERVGPDCDYSGIAAVFFSRPEYLWISEADGPAGRSRFMGLWCLKEAWGKKNGTGLSDEILKTSFLSQASSRRERGGNHITGRFNESTWAVCWSDGEEPDLSIREVTLDSAGTEYSVETLPSGGGITYQKL